MSTVAPADRIDAAIVCDRLLSMPCINHPDRAGEQLCFFCGQRICSACVSTRVAQTACVGCADKELASERRGGLVKAALFGAVALVAIVGVVGFFRSYQPSFNYGKYAFEVKRLGEVQAQSPCDEAPLAMLLEVMKEAGDHKGVDGKLNAFKTTCNKEPWLPWLTTDYGARTLKVKALALALAKEPCDRPKTVELLDQMLGAGDGRGVVERADAFLARCGEMEQVHWKKFGAYKRLSEFDNAIAEATKLMTADPYDRDYPWWRGDAKLLKGDADGAVADYLLVKQLCPDCLVNWALADAYEKAGKACEGIPHLQASLDNHPNLRNANEVERRIGALKQRADCGIAAR
jgi:tetratricopeptide (TPR) repeat protein